MAQVGIAVFGLLAIFLTTDRNPRVQRFACLAGLCGQPFWFWATYDARQWGIFAMAFVYTLLWARGAWNHWVRPWLIAREERRYREALWDQAMGKGPRP